MQSVAEKHEFASKFIYAKANSENVLQVPQNNIFPPLLAPAASRKTDCLLAREGGTKAAVRWLDPDDPRLGWIL